MTGLRQITKEEYAELLENHDWFYQYSDDFRVYRKGEEERSNLRAFARQCDELKLMYDKYVWKILEGK